MSFLDVVRAAAASPLAQFNVFLLEYKPRGHCVYVLLEGRSDPAFYRRYLEERLPAGFCLRFVRCGNRRAVVEYVAKFVSRYPPNPRVLALVDKDHSDLVVGATEFAYAFGFQTEVYSVENYVCDPNVVRRYCVDCLGMDDVGDLCENIGAEYGRLSKVFCEEMVPCMAWIIAARRRGDRVNLGNLDTSKIIQLDEELSPRRTVSDSELDSYLERTTGGSEPTMPVPREAVRAIAEELRSLPPKRWLRGKQELWFTVAFLRGLSQAAKQPGVRAGPRVDLNYSNGLEVLAPRCEPPQHLQRFLAESFGALSSSA
jgi:hypothetical protein